MGIETQPGDVYRLIVALEERVVEGADRRYRCFEQAQARVAEAVCRHARTERVRAVAVQRGRPTPPTDRDGNGSPARGRLDDGDYSWTIEKRWGAEVIQRIMLQNGVAPAVAADPSPADENVGLPLAAPEPPSHAQTDPSPTDEHVGHPPPALQPPSPVRAELLRTAGKHKSTRWPVATAIAVVIVAIIALALVHTGGHPSRLLSLITSTQPAVKDELPFDARTSFAPEVQQEQPGLPSDR